MDEVQFKKGGGTEVGITVDPVKIDSLSEFGTPKQVAKRVLDAEVLLHSYAWHRKPRERAREDLPTLNPEP
jgi:hypothetical protein